MSRDYDAQLLESVGVRRRRLRDALLRGALQARRPTTDNVRGAVAGVVVAAALCAGCVGWSFLRHQLAVQQSQQRGGTPAVAPSPSPVPSSGPSAVPGR